MIVKKHCSQLHICEHCRVFSTTVVNLQKITGATYEPPRLSREFYILNTCHSIDRKMLTFLNCKAPSHTHTLMLFCSWNGLQFETHLCGPGRRRSVAEICERTRVKWPRVSGPTAAASNSRHIVVFCLQPCCTAPVKGPIHSKSNCAV